MKRLAICLVLAGVLFAMAGLASAQVYEFSKPNVPVNDDSLGRYWHYPVNPGMHSLVTRGDTLYATWYDNRDNNNNKIYFSRSTNGGAVWDPNVIVHDTSTASHFFSAIAVSPSGELYVCWEDDREQLDERRVYCSKSTNEGTTWGRNVPVSQMTCHWGMISSICVAQDGRVFVAWGGSDGKPYLSRSTDGGQSFGPNYRIADSVTLVATPSIGVDDSGQVYITYASPPQGGGAVFIWFTKAVNSEDTSFLPPLLVSDTAYYREKPSLVTKPNGDTYIAYRSTNVPWVDIYLVKSTDRGRTFGRSVRVSDVRPPGYVAREPSVAIDTGQGVYVAWFDNRWGGWHGFFSASTNGGASFGPSVLIEDTSVSPTAYRAFQNLAVDPNTGTAYVIWVDERWAPGVAWDIYSARGVLQQGVEELSARPSVCLPFQLSVQPNPFSSFASVPGHDKGFFALYDISGRKVGVYRGDRIGWGVSPGVYFLRPDTRNLLPDTRILRIVKLR